MLGKLRTRQHIIEDLGFNHVECQILNAGFTMHRHGINDYGYDGIIDIFKETGEIDGRMVYFQLKSTDKIKYVVKRKAFAFDLSVRDLQLWLGNSLPTLLILYDAQKIKSYFIDLQLYFRGNRESLQNVSKFVRVYLPEHQIFNPQTVISLR